MIIGITVLVILLFSAGGLVFYRIEKKRSAEFEDKNRELREEVVERKYAEEALWESIHRKQIAYDQAITYAEQLNKQIIERRRAEERIRASLKEKEVLLREIHHRVKNNMQVISSLLKLQAGYVKDKADIEMFKESQNRIKSMALVHEKLYQSEDLSNIDFKGYIEHLANTLFRSYGINGTKTALKVDAEDVMLGVDTAIPCGLIINELVSNSLKYAFPAGREGEIEIVFRLIDENEIELMVSDNGVGIPEDLDFRNSNSLGLKLVNILTDQIGGRLELDRSKGTRFRIKLRR